MALKETVHSVHKDRLIQLSEFAIGRVCCSWCGNKIWRLWPPSCLPSECEVNLFERLHELNMAGMFGLLAVVVLSLLSIAF
jgi:hypothetical protein